MPKTFTRKKIFIVALAVFTAFLLLFGRLAYLMIVKSDYYYQKAEALHERERSIKAKRGVIYDRNGIELAGNKPVCSISVIHAQITDPEEVIKQLCLVLDLDREEVEEKVSRNSMREKIKSNVEKETADRLRKMNLDGVMIDEDYKRYYPYNTLASKVLGFTGGDNQGIVGLEVTYDKILQGIPGSILTLTDANGMEIENAAEGRMEPVAGNNIYISIDANIQKYAQQAATKVLKAKQAKRVSVILMNPQNGEIYAMVNVPEYNLNEPYALVDVKELYADRQTDLQETSEEETDNVERQNLTGKEKQDALNHMWRNFCINDTYEPGSTFKIVTATAALEEGVVKVDDTFSCPGFRIVEDRRIRCYKAGGHGTETFREGIMNSCNPVFMDVGARVGVANMYKNYRKLGLFEKTGVDLPGEASSIMHKQEDVGAVELATMSFGQSFQITPLQLLRAASAVVNGGTLVTPHFGMYATNEEGEPTKTFSYTKKEQAIQKTTSDTMKELLEAVVAEGSGNKGSVEGYRIGGKTATSEKLPRGNGKYLVSFIGYAPQENPQVMVYVVIDEPNVDNQANSKLATTMASQIMTEILPYLGVEKSADAKAADAKSSDSSASSDSSGDTPDDMATESDDGE